MSDGFFLAVAGFLLLLLLLFLGPGRDSPVHDLVAGLMNVILGLGATSEGARHGYPWAGAINLLIGLLLLWAWWTRGGGRDRARRWLGAKSAAIRARLARGMRDARVPA